MKIAVIEDEKPIREGLVHILNKISPEYQVVGSAKNGAEGLILLEEEMPDLIMLDPPRDGVNPKALMKILNFGVERLVYIACKPTSLARDLEMIQGRGYKVEKISGVDLFPGTYHVETICQLVKVEKNI